MSEDLVGDASRRMTAAVDAAKREFSSIRTGRAHPALLERIQVEAYGSSLPLNQVASITAPEPRMLLVQPWDKGLLKDVEKAIMQADVGLSPAIDGEIVRVPVPALSEERRREMVRLARKEAEEQRVAIRNVRRDANETAKKLAKSGDSSEDEVRRLQDEIQTLTDRSIGQVDELLSAKEKEILEV